MQAQGGVTREEVVAVAKERARLTSWFVALCAVTLLWMLAVDWLVGRAVAVEGSYTVLFFSVGVVGVVVIGAMGVVLSVHVYRLAKALRVSEPWVWVVLSLYAVPALVAFVVLRTRATALLREAGMEVGFWGPSERQIAAWTGPPP